jgi:HD superfamily phosphohydrolase
MHVATLAFDQLARTKGATLEVIFGKVPELKTDTLAKARQIVRLAAILHDVGHAPFSHAAEEVIHEASGHEELTIEMIKDKPILGDMIDSAFFQGCSSVVARIIKGGDQLEPQLKVLKDIISGQMDADRTDYLLRDSHHCGVEYGIFDYRRMVECLSILEGPGESLEIALDRDGLHTFEALILARYQMNSQVYFHRIRRIYDYYLRQYFTAIGTDCFDSPDKILSHNDVTAMAMIMRDAADNSAAGNEWAERIVNRRHHREIHATGATTNATDLRASTQLFARLRAEFPKLDFIWDKSHATIHSLLLPEDMEEGSWVRLNVIDKRGATKLMGDQSHILRRVPRSFQVARIFVDVDESDQILREKLRDYAAAEYAKLGGR